MTPSGLGLYTANRSQGFEVIPAGTLVTLVTTIRPGTIGIEGLLKRTAKGDAEMLDLEFTIWGGDYDKRKIWSNLVLDGTTAGHAKAGEFSRALLRAIFEASHGLDPNDTSPAATARLAAVTLASFQGCTFLATLEIETGSQKPDGSFYPDRNKIGRVLRLGEPGYQKLDQPPPQPIERAAPPQQPAAGAPGTATTTTTITKPAWAS